MSTDKYAFQVTEPKKRQISMTQDTWQQHILADSGRWEFKDSTPIKETVADPHMIIQSSKVSASQVYFRLGAHPEYPDLWVKIPVLFRLPEEGTVSTAMLQPDAIQGVDKTSGGLIYVNWRRS